MLIEKGGRENQEDRIVVRDSDPEILGDRIAVVDGMGGYDSSEVAAQILAEAFATHDLPSEVVNYASTEIAKSEAPNSAACYVGFMVKINERTGETNVLIQRAGDVRLAVVDIDTGDLLYETEDEEVKYHDDPERIGKVTHWVGRGSDGKPTGEGYRTDKKSVRVITASDGLWGLYDTSEEALAVIQGVKDPQQAVEMLFADSKRKAKELDITVPDNISIVVYDFDPENSNQASLTWEKDEKKLSRWEALKQSVTGLLNRFARPNRNRDYGDIQNETFEGKDDEKIAKSIEKTLKNIRSFDDLQKYVSALSSNEHLQEFFIQKDIDISNYPDFLSELLLGQSEENWLVFFTSTCDFRRHVTRVWLSQPDFLEKYKIRGIFELLNFLINRSGNQLNILKGREGLVFNLQTNKISLYEIHRWPEPLKSLAIKAFKMGEK